MANLPVIMDPKAIAPVQIWEQKKNHIQTPKPTPGFRIYPLLKLLEI